ncbi:MAG: hypothetical protein ABUL60_22340 [Myxococcales bacterium]
MAAVDPEQHEVVFRIAVIGGVGERFVEALKLTNGELELGAVAGYRSRFVFQLFAADPWSSDAEGRALEELVPALDALVLTDDFAAGNHFSSTAVERLSKVLSPLKLRIPSAVFGGPALAEEWQSLSGVPLVAHVEPTAEQAQTVVKSLVKALLRSNIRSTPPPPAAG